MIRIVLAINDQEPFASGCVHLFVLGTEVEPIEYSNCFDFGDAFTCIRVINHDTWWFSCTHEKPMVRLVEGQRDRLLGVRRQWPRSSNFLSLAVHDYSFIALRKSNKHSAPVPLESETTRVNCCFYVSNMLVCCSVDHCYLAVLFSGVFAAMPYINSAGFRVEVHLIRTQGQRY